MSRNIKLALAFALFGACAIGFQWGYSFRDHKAPPIDKYIADMQGQLDTQEIRITILERHLDATGQ